MMLMTTETHHHHLVKRVMCQYRTMFFCQLYCLFHLHMLYSPLTLGKGHRRGVFLT